jgi:magnesium chelatase accessory protein
VSGAPAAGVRAVRSRTRRPLAAGLQSPRRQTSTPAAAAERRAAPPPSLLGLLQAAPLDWHRDGGQWPNRRASRFVRAGGLRWHVQVLGDGPVLLLLHGTGAATHSWRDLLPLLAKRFTVVAPDLPGHGFSEAMLGSRLSLPGMAAAVAALAAELEVTVDFAAGHSAGAAILARMALDGRLAPRLLVSLNGALLPLPGWQGSIFRPMARLLSLNPLVPRLFSWRAREPAAVRRLIASTGSTIDAEGIRGYAQLLRNPAHVSGALQMMAHWDLQPLARDLPRLAVPLLLVAGSNDRTLPAADAQRVARRVRGARGVVLEGLGHLAHEEQPGRIARLLIDEAGVR